jgi:hypothetical protein
MLTPSTSSFGSDPYASTGYGWQGMPLMGWDQAATNFLKDAGYGSNEQAFWSWFWTDMANNLKDYPNAIFEAWNEPNVGSDTDAIPAGYMTYLQTMYTAIRQTGASNIVMMQWHMGWQPNGYGNTLAWASQIDNAIHPVNIVYTTHFYYYAPTDLTSYWATDQAIASMGVSAPLVINEEGSCMSSSQNRQNDLTWWTNLVSAQRDLGVGACAYYWLSDGGLGGVYSGETMLSGGYTPNSMGQAYIDAYVPSAVSQAVSVVTPSPTVEPTATPTPAVTLPTEQPSTEPTQTAEPTPEPAQTETSTTQPTSEPTTAFPDEPTINHAPTYTAKPTSTAQPTTQPSAEAPQTQSQKGTPILDGNWLFFNWIRYNLWFSVRYW